MPRIRTIKPEFPEDETLGKVSREARYLFILLWTQCDDHGRFRAAPALLRGQLFPYDDDLTASQIVGWLGELAETSRIVLYTVDEQRYGYVTSWGKHQRIDNAGKPLFPDPPRSAANRGDSLLDHDLDQEKDHDHRPPRGAAGELPADLWTTYADRLFKTAKDVQNPRSWKKKVAINCAGDKDLEERALELTAQYELTTTQLVDALLGQTNVLMNAPRRIQAV